LGQKVNPLGFRLGATQNHKANWFSKFISYPELLEEDTKIREFFEIKNNLAGISKIEINRDSSCKRIEISISLCLPGKLLGKSRENSSSKLKSIYQSLEKIISNKRSIILKISVIKNPGTDAILIAYFIVAQLEKRVLFRRIIKKAIEKAQAANIPGIKVQISGRLNGAEIARTKWIRQGRVPLQTLKAKIDYAQKQANTIYGALGIKVWLFKGEVL